MTSTAKLRKAAKLGSGENRSEMAALYRSLRKFNPKKAREFWTQSKREYDALLDQIASETSK